MNKNGVFLSSVDVIIRYFDKFKIINLFDEKPTYYEKYREIKDKSTLLNKKIIFVIDDLDRVQSVDKICKIFNVFELLKCENIKCIYLYDIEILVEKFKNNIDQKIDVVKERITGSFTNFYNFVRKYIDREIFLTKIDDYMNACIKLCNNDRAIVLVNERMRINKELSDIKKYDISFDKYCDFNPRKINGIMKEYIDIVNSKKLNGLIGKNNKELLFDALLFKYYFENTYLKYIKSNDSFENFLNKEYYMSKNKMYILYDAISLCIFDCANKLDS